MPQKGGQKNYTLESFRDGGDVGAKINATIVVPVSGQVGGQATASASTASTMSTISTVPTTNTTTMDVVQKLKQIYDNTDAVNQEILVEIKKLTTSLSELLNTIRAPAAAAAAAPAATNAAAVTLFNEPAAASTNMFGVNTSTGENEIVNSENTENGEYTENGEEYNTYGYNNTNGYNYSGMQYPMNNTNDGSYAYGSQYNTIGYGQQGYSTPYYQAPPSYGYYGAGGARRKTLSARKPLSNRKTRHATPK